MMNPSNGQTYSNTGAWTYNALVWEGDSFDSCYGHPSGTNEYHQHVVPVCLSSATSATAHSPIIGFASDGYPIYGPFGYTNASNPNSAIKRMLTSYQLRSITTRQTYWNGTTLASSLYGPAVSTSFPIGSFNEDYGYVANAGDLDMW